MMMSDIDIVREHLEQEGVGVGAVSSSNDNVQQGQDTKEVEGGESGQQDSTAASTNYIVTDDGVILYTDYDNDTHEVLPSSTFLINLSPGLLHYLSSRDRKGRRGRKPRTASDDEEDEVEVKVAKPAPLSKKEPAYFSPALSKLAKKSGKKGAGGLKRSQIKSVGEKYMSSRGEGKRQRKAPSWMTQDDFVVDHETVEATKSAPRKRELDDIEVVKERIMDDGERLVNEDAAAVNNDEEGEEVKRAGDPLGFKSWLSEPQGKEVEDDDAGGIVLKPGESPTKAMKDKMTKPFACAVCQEAFSQPVELQEHIRTMHDSSVKIKKPPIDDDTQSVKCDQCFGWFSPRGIERHKTMAHGGYALQRRRGADAQKMEVTSTTPEGGDKSAPAAAAATTPSIGAAAGAETQCHLCMFRAVRPEQLVKHLKYRHKVYPGGQQQQAKSPPSGEGGVPAAAGGGADQPVIDIRPDGNKIYIECHGLNLQPEDAARICAEVMTIPDNAEIIIVK